MENKDQKGAENYNTSYRLPIMKGAKEKIASKEYQDVKTEIYHEINQLPEEEQDRRINQVIESRKKNKLDLSDPLFSDLVIDINETLPPPKPFLVQHTNGREVSLGTLGNFSVISGKAKSRKTFSVAIATAAALGHKRVLDMFEGKLPEDKRNVVYMDTEQGKYHVQKLTKRICSLSGVSAPDNLKVYHLRSKTPAERLLIIESVIKNTPNLGLVVIDGVRDLVTSINDEEQATNVTTKLLNWSADLDIHILTVLHQNKGKGNTDLRGHLGTEFTNKGEIVLEVEKHHKDDDISVVAPGESRDIGFEEFAFSIDEKGLPYMVNLNGLIDQSNGAVTMDYFTDENLYLLLQRLYCIQEEYSYNSLVDELKGTLEIGYNIIIGVSMIKTIITKMKNEGFIKNDGNRKPYYLTKKSRKEINDIFGKDIQIQIE